MLQASTSPVRKKPNGLLAGVQVMLKRAWPVFGRTDWKPIHHVKVMNKRDWQFFATGRDPQFQLTYPHPIRAGWYMLEVKLQLPSTFAETKLYPNMGDGESDSTALSLRVRTERLAKRLVYLPKAATLRFDPMETAGTFQVQYLRLARVTRSFAINRMRKKLTENHPAHAIKARQKKHTAAGGYVQPGDDVHLWTDYTKLFRPDSNLMAYANWIEQIELPNLPSHATQAATMATWQWKPHFSIVTPVFNTDEAALRACLDSVLAQTYPDWEWCIADDASTAPHIGYLLNEYAKRDARIKVSHRFTNGHIVESSNTALKMATGEFVALLDCVFQRSWTLVSV